MRVSMRLLWGYCKGGSLDSGPEGPFIRAPYYIWDPKRDPNLENYPFVDI